MKVVIKLVNQSSSLCIKKSFLFRPVNFSSKMSGFTMKTTDPEITSDHNDHIKRIEEFIPKLTDTLHKGQCGRIGVIGGSAEYTGAPYFAAISSLKMGADLVYVFCCKDAAPVIKSYSPELIVHPILDSIDPVKKIEPWLSRLHVLVIGPGMGRDPGLLKNVGDIIMHCKDKIKPSMPLVIDADGLFLISENLNLIKDYSGPLILTPNLTEFSRLSNKMSETNPFKMATTLNAIVVQKGTKDLIINGMHFEGFKFMPELVLLSCDASGSNRRCGGQGDILSGCMATFLAWLQIFFKNNTNFDFNSAVKDPRISKMELFTSTYMRYSLAAYGACLVTRTCSGLAFQRNGRGMTATDMIEFIPQSFKSLFKN